MKDLVKVKVCFTHRLRLELCTERNKAVVELGAKFFELKAVLKISEYSQEYIEGLKACSFIKKETPAQVFSCEYSGIFKNIYFEEHLRTAASELTLKYPKNVHESPLQAILNLFQALIRIF